MANQPLIDNAASYLQLYSDGNAKAINRFQIKVQENKVIVKDAKSDRELKIHCKGVKIGNAAGL